MAEPTRTHRWLAVLAAALGALAVAAGEPYPSGRHRAAEREAHHVSAVDLARWIRDLKAGLRVVDVRPTSEFDGYHIPGAEHVPFAELSRREWARDSIVVLYAEDDGRAAKAAQVLRVHGADSVRILAGGLVAWIDQIVELRLTALGPAATRQELAARREQLELSRYFGGTPIVSPSAAARPGGRPPSEAAAVARIIRRGC